MKTLRVNEDGAVEALLGSVIQGAVSEAITLAAERGEQVSFEFNGVTVRVCGESDAALILRDWSRALMGYTEKVVGPHPAPVLSADEQASDAHIAAEQRTAQLAREAEWAREAAEKAQRLEDRLGAAGPIELSDESKWAASVEANRDGYGGAVMAYAERWARLMQFEMAAGVTLSDAAKPTSQAADIDGITGFMYGCAVSILAASWKHGDVLRRWHNLDTQIGTEGERANESGGVLNPALLSIG